MIPCKGCLKFPVCRHKAKIRCQDIIDWVLPVMQDDGPSNRLIEFETFFDREVGVILTTSFVMEMKEEKDNHACLIVKNM
jgi:hypothetical protein